MVGEAKGALGEIGDDKRVDERILQKKDVDIESGSAQLISRK